MSLSNYVHIFQCTFGKLRQAQNTANKTFHFANTLRMCLVFQMFDRQTQPLFNAHKRSHRTHAPDLMLEHHSIFYLRAQENSIFQYEIPSYGDHVAHISKVICVLNRPLYLYSILLDLNKFVLDKRAIYVGIIF